MLQMGWPAAVAGAGMNSLFDRMLPTKVPVVGFAVYDKAVALPAELVESCGTTVEEAEVPAEFAVDLFSNRAVIVPAVVCVPEIHACVTRIVLVALPVTLHTSVALEAGANEPDEAE
jgi:hypothetical protein